MLPVSLLPEKLLRWRRIMVQRVIQNHGCCLLGLPFVILTSHRGAKVRQRRRPINSPWPKMKLERLPERAVAKWYVTFVQAILGDPKLKWFESSERVREHMWCSCRMIKAVQISVASIGVMAVVKQAISRVRRSSRNPCIYLYYRVQVKRSEGCTPVIVCDINKVVYSESR